MSRKFLVETYVKEGYQKTLKCLSMVLHFCWQNQHRMAAVELSERQKICFRHFCGRQRAHAGSHSGQLSK